MPDPAAPSNADTGSLLDRNTLEDRNALEMSALAAELRTELSHELNGVDDDSDEGGDEDRAEKISRDSKQSEGRKVRLLSLQQGEDGGEHQEDGFEQEEDDGGAVYDPKKTPTEVVLTRQRKKPKNLENIPDLEKKGSGSGKK